jgi:taurine dioxygenase
MADRSLDEGAAVLGEIFDLSETAPFVKEVRWSMGDIIIWDNRFLSHTSGRNSGPEEETMMYRITLKDGMPLCASQMTAESVAA